MTDLSLDHSDLVAELLKELSNHNERVEERKIALYELMKLTQEESFSVWDEHFKTILLLLLETLGDKEVSSRTYKQQPVFVSWVACHCLLIKHYTYLAFGEMSLCCCFSVHEIFTIKYFFFSTKQINDFEQLTTGKTLLTNFYSNVQLFFAYLNQLFRSKNFFLIELVVLRIFEKCSFQLEM